MTIKSWHNGKPVTCELRQCAPPVPKIAEPMEAVETAPVDPPVAAPPTTSRECSAALRECLVVLRGRGDLQDAEASFCGAVLKHSRLLPEMIPSCRKLVLRHRGKLAAELAAAALGELPQARETAAAAPTSVDDVTLSAAPSARRGRPPKGEVALTKAERNKRWRESKNLVTVDVPTGLAARIRALRDARGGTTGELLREALDALERSAATG